MSDSFLKRWKNPLKKQGFLRKSVQWLLIAYGVICIHLYLHQEIYLMEPNVDPPGMEASHLNELEFTYSPVQNEEDDEAEIHYRKYESSISPTKGAVFYFHGNKGNMDKCECEIPFFLELGYDVWTMDYRGYGDSKGTVSEPALKADALGVFKLVAAQVDPEPIVIWGRSFGSGIAASVAAEMKPKMLVLETPYWSLIDAARSKYPVIPSFLFRYELPNHKFLPSVDCPIHLIHGTEDQKIPFHSSERLFELCEVHALDVEPHWIPGGVHNLREPETREAFKKVAEEILK